MSRCGTEASFRPSDDGVSTDVFKDFIKSASEYPGNETASSDVASKVSTEPARTRSYAVKTESGGGVLRVEKLSNFVANRAVQYAFEEGRHVDGTIAYSPEHICDGAHGPHCTAANCERLHSASALPVNTTVFVPRSRILDDDVTFNAAREEFGKGAPRRVCGLFTAAAAAAHGFATCIHGLHLLDQGTGEVGKAQTVALLVPSSWIVDNLGKVALLVPTSYANLCNRKVCPYGRNCTYIHLEAPAPTTKPTGLLFDQTGLSERQNTEPAVLQALLDAALDELENTVGPNAIPDASATWSAIAEQLSHFGAHDRDFATNPRIGARKGGAVVYTWDPNEGPLGTPIEDLAIASDLPPLPAFFAAAIPVKLPQLLGMDVMIPLSLCPFPPALEDTLASAIGTLFPLGDSARLNVEILNIRAPNPDWKEDPADHVPTWSDVFAVVSATLHYPHLRSSDYPRKCLASLYLVPVAA